MVTGESHYTFNVGEEKASVNEELPQIICSKDCSRPLKVANERHCIPISETCWHKLEGKWLLDFTEI